ncbi:putative dehydrogenase [Gammaproteobacteria bacterium]
MSKSKKPRAAVIGCGNIGSRWDEADRDTDAVLTHAGAWHRLGLLTALADSNPERLAVAGRRWGVTACYSDYRALLANEHPDLVSIATPTALRLPVVEAILAAGTRALLLEKPIAASLVEARAIVAAAHAAGAVVAVNYVRRYDATLGQIAARLCVGMLGVIQHGVGRYGKGIVENGSHLIDLIQWWLGPARLGSVLRRLEDNRPDHDPTLDAVLKVGPIEAPAPIYLLGVDYQHYALFELDIVGTSGRITLSDRGAYIQHWEAISDAMFPGYRILRPAEELHTDLTHTLSRAAEDLLAVWRSERSLPLCTLKDAFAALEIALTLRDMDSI